jgi:hypothetical protein
MNGKLLMTTALTGLLCFTTVVAQDGMNFSGTWVKARRRASHSHKLPLQRRERLSGWSSNSRRPRCV